MIGEPSPKFHLKVVFTETSVLVLIKSKTPGAQMFIPPPAPRGRVIEAFTGLSITSNPVTVHAESVSVKVIL